MREDNFSPNMGFMEDYPPEVVFSKILFVLWLCGNWAFEPHYLHRRNTHLPLEGRSEIAQQFTGGGRGDA